ncbi:MAG: SMP-30/gluconolactonase/LRE family protein [Pseudomonadota bacterium]|nr:SMP-30/gluconolactonase/LRE family protein [Pseudomonadota bacterium]
MRELTATKVFEGLVFGEGIRWHDGKLWVSDMFGHRVLTIDGDGRDETILEVPYRPSGLGFLPDGGLLVVSMQDRKLLKVSNGEVSEYASLKPDATGDVNDLVVLPSGDAYAGNFGFDLFGGSEQPCDTCIQRVAADGSVTRVADQLSFPNGMVVTPDGKTLIVAETFAHRLTAFTIAPDGGLGERRVFAELGDRMPDGIALDAELAVWVSSFGTGEFVRVVEGGEVTHRVKPAPNAVTCTLGGPDRRTLYMVAADTEIERLAKGDSKAWVVKTRVEVPGAGWP